MPRTQSRRSIIKQGPDGSIGNDTTATLPKKVAIPGDDAVQKGAGNGQEWPVSIAVQNSAWQAEDQTQAHNSHITCVKCIVLPEQHGIVLYRRHGHSPPAKFPLQRCIAQPPFRIKANQELNTAVTKVAEAIKKYHRMVSCCRG